MSLDFQDLQKQVGQMGEGAPDRAAELQDLRAKASDLLKAHAADSDRLRAKVDRTAQKKPNLRCAKPGTEGLDQSFSLPPAIEKGILIAADGSQITPNRHNQVNFALVNVGGIILHTGSSEAPVISMKGKLYYGDEMYTKSGSITEARISLDRDLHERQYLVEMVDAAMKDWEVSAPVITLTDGPLELWGAKERAGDQPSYFKKCLKDYKDSLLALSRKHAVTAGYVDKPRADLVVRLMEIAVTEENDLGKTDDRKFPGVTDLDLFANLLSPGERSAIFELQSGSKGDYTDELALHFFYLNVGRPGSDWFARVEIPAWVAESREMIDTLHAVLYRQSQVLGGAAYPYILHRAHEAAVVKMEEKEQLEQMIILELRRRGVKINQVSSKQRSKNYSTGKRRL